MLWYILKYYTRTLSDHITVAFERQHKYVKRCYSDDFNHHILIRNRKICNSVLFLMRTQQDSPGGLTVGWPVVIWTMPINFFFHIFGILYSFFFFLMIILH